jgi:allophanate hydrolase
VATETVLGARAAHLAAGIGRALRPGDRLPLGDDTRAEVGMTLDTEPRLNGGLVRITRSMQTHLFAPEMLERFQSTAFQRDARGNRMGARLEFEGAPFAATGQLSILSEVIVPGDIQMTGDGTPFVLLGECQTTGGYPRIGTVIPADLPRVVQAGPGVSLRFQEIDLADAVEVQRRHVASLAKLPTTIRPLLRDPAQMQDLLSYQLISGAISAHDDHH